MTLRMNRFTTPAEAAHALAGRVAAELAAALEIRERALLLVSGGRSPSVFFDALSRRALAWRRIDLSLVDERSVPPDAEAANAALVRAALLRGAAADARWIALMPPALFAAAGDPWEAAGRAVTCANQDADLAQPAVVVLGLGTDGHTASLFPDAPQWPEAACTQARYVRLQPSQAAHARVSLSLHALRSQKKCYLWAVGADKMATLASLQALCDRVTQDAAGNAALIAAGPVACLMADPASCLEVYCSSTD